MLITGDPSVRPPSTWLLLEGTAAAVDVAVGDMDRTKVEVVRPGADMDGTAGRRVSSRLSPLMMI